MLDEETRDGRGVTLSYIQAFYSVSHVAMFGILVGTVQFTALVQRLAIFFLLCTKHYQVTASFWVLNSVKDHVDVW